MTHRSNSAHFSIIACAKKNKNSTLETNIQRVFFFLGSLKFSVHFVFFFNIQIQSKLCVCSNLLLLNWNVKQFMLYSIDPQFT